LAGFLNRLSGCITAARFSGEAGKLKLGYPDFEHPSFQAHVILTVFARSKCSSPPEA